MIILKSPAEVRTMAAGGIAASAVERLKEGMVLAIQPMVDQGGCHVRTLKENWTVVTADSSLSAHFEHTVAITRDGPRILTQT